METRISSSSMDNANKIKTSVMLLLLYGICSAPIRLYINCLVA